ncbi:Disease resistance protein [Artemisia annua]|uniref:Disease resistance protein n=1 Tax=Artemisia annua TaxID=35608 RepID=A0A2U1Q201_ARTAN|nr:Disease resistance protein [Artemisia annua]
MTYTGLELFMENLKQLIYSNDNPLINNHPSILSKRPQLQLLYEELDSMIQILFHGEHTELQYLKRRFKNTAEEAQDIIDLFVSGVHYRKIGYSPRPDVFRTFLNLDHVMRSIKSIKEELINTSMDNMKIDSSQRTKSQQVQSAAAGTSNSRSTLGSKKLFEEIVVGLDHHVEVIRDKLVEDQKQLDVVSIVGMGGLGKTTLATKVFNDRFIVYHFNIRAWVTVSQTYERRDVLIQILASLGVQVDIESTSDFKLREMLHKSLKGQRYLIVIDDIWSKEAWDNLKVLFPDDDTSSRILLTSRLNEVGLHAKSKPNGLVHFLSYLTEKQSWELLCKKVFHGEECPEGLIKHGMQIANKCQGLPLSVVVIAGLLAKEPENIDLWKKISCSVASYIASDGNKHMEALDLSYNHLPLHLRDCFLYLGGFPEDFKFPARWLIGLWMAEGFIQEAENQSFEDIGEAYLLDLVGRNLVIVAERRSNGGVKSFKVHDLVRELCLRIAQEERFFLRINAAEVAQHEVITSYKLRRLFTNQNTYIVNLAHPPTPSIRSLIYFHTSRCLLIDTAECFRSFALLRVLDLQNYELINFPEGIVLLVHLRYLAIRHALVFPSSICNLTSLQTLIVKTSQSTLVLPSNISDLVNLRHLWSNSLLYLPSINRPMNLQTISDVELGDLVEYFHKYFPMIKKLSSVFYSNGKSDFELLGYLETLKLTGIYGRNCRNNKISFPTTLKQLTLVRCHLPWSDMSIIQSLPNLEVLKLSEDAFEGSLWKTDDEAQFPQLKFLRLELLKIKQWEAYSINFPCLKELQLVKCYDLKEIPLEIGDIPTLELIKIDCCSRSVVESIKRIQVDQYDVGNYDLKIYVDGSELSCINRHLRAHGVGSSKELAVPQWNSQLGLQSSQAIIKQLELELELDSIESSFYQAQAQAQAQKLARNI